MEYRDYYKVLAVDKNADEATIRKSYDELAHEYHPDSNKDDATAEERFKAISEAYEVLGNPKAREKYDQLGEAWHAYRQNGRHHAFNWNQWTQGGLSFDELLGNGAPPRNNNFSEFYEAIFGSEWATIPKAGEDITQEIEISLSESYHGTMRVLQTSDNRRLEVNIPAGSRTGTKIRLRGQGTKGRAGADNGDMYLTIVVASDPRFEVEEDDIKINAPLDLYTAILGGSIEVKTLKGLLKLKISPETQNGKTLRLKNQGMPRRGNTGQFGDLYVTFKVKLPQNLNHEERALFKELRDIRGY